MSLCIIQQDLSQFPSNLCPWSHSDLWEISSKSWLTLPSLNSFSNCICGWVASSPFGPKCSWEGTCADMCPAVAPQPAGLGHQLVPLSVIYLLSPCCEFHQTAVEEARYPTPPCWVTPRDTGLFEVRASVSSSLSGDKTSPAWYYEAVLI